MTVIADRYTESNRAYGLASIERQTDHSGFNSWLDSFEHGIMDIMEPDLNIVLDVPPEIARQLILKKGERKYLKRGKRDLNEKDLEYQRRVRRAYLSVACGDFVLHPNFLDNYWRRPRWRFINCAPEGTLLTSEEIHQAVLESIRPDLALVDRDNATR